MESISSTEQNYTGGDKTIFWKESLSKFCPKLLTNILAWFGNIAVPMLWHWRCSVRKGVLINFAKFTEKHLCQSLFFNRKILLKKQLWHRCFPANFAKFLRTPFLQNTSGRLLRSVVIHDLRVIKINFLITMDRRHLFPLPICLNKIKLLVATT